MKYKKHQDNHDLEELRRLIMGAELDKLENLSDSVEIPENFSSVVGEILPEAMIKSSQQGEQLSEAMVPTVEEIVRLSIKKDINKFADALFPVIGPAIRKSITETFRQMLQSLNQILEQSFSWQGAKWRLQSMRTGIPVAQIALLHGLVYRVEQVFLIHRRTGLLLNHIEQEDIQNQNADMVSSMLGAINDFVGDSFAVETNRSLGSIEVGNLSIWIEQGPDAILAVVIRGEAPNSLRLTLQQVLEKLQHEFAYALSEFVSDTSAFASSRDNLSECMQAQYQNERNKKSLKSIVFFVVLAILLLYWVATEIFQSIKHNEYLAILENEPGYVITNVSEQEGILVIKGLRDPLSPPPEVLLTRSVLSDDEVSHKFEPYQSLKQEFTLERARMILEPPESVSLLIEDKLLVVKGIARDEWWEKLDARLPMIAGINSYDVSRLKRQFSPAMLSPPDSVSMQLDAGVLYVEGHADNDWILSLGTAAEAHDEIVNIDTGSLVNLTEVALIAEIAALEKEIVFFDVATSFNFDTMDSPKISTLAKNIINLAKTLSRNVLIIVRGHSDSVGKHEDNVFLSVERANYVAENLFNTGISTKYIEIKGLEVPIEKEISEQEKRYNRRVSFEVIIE